MKKKIILITLILIIGFGVIKLTQKNTPNVRYKTEPLKKGSIVEYVTASGTLNPVTTTLVGSQVSGIIKEIYVDYNSKVKKGQLIALIDPSLQKAGLIKAKANLIAAQADYNSLSAVTKNNKRIMERDKALYEDDLTPKLTYEQSETDYISSKARLALAAAKIEQAKADLNTAQTNLNYTKIVSPTDGIVISRAVEVGQTVISNLQASTLFTVAEDLTKMQIDAKISEADIAKVKDGQTVDFTVDSYPEKTFKGVVTQIRNNPETIQNVVTYSVIIDVSNNELLLKPGLTANVEIITNNKQNINLVSNDSLRFVPPGEEIAKYNTQGLWVLKNNIPQRVSIRTGISDDVNTEIISKNLKEGDLIIKDIIDNKNSSKKGLRKRRRPGPF